MPIAAPRPCSHAGCRVLATAGGRCADHQREVWHKKPDAVKRLSGRRLQAMREAKFADNPLCAKCGQLPRTHREWELDHITPSSEGGSNDSENMQVLCIPCHDEKSQAESQRARRRA